jgi:PTH1 family peptidyl-tRNA hydrolase
MKMDDVKEVLPTQIKLIVGLGNPGPEYDGTRHNIGFDVLDELCSRYKGKRSSGCKSHLYRFELNDREIILQKPKTYMNLSGEAVKRICHKENIDLSEILVVYDDLALKPGRMRIRLGGSAGGHNGIKSLISCFGGQDQFLRLRLGIGAPIHSSETADYVLARFQEKERPLMREVARTAADAILVLCDEGHEAAMNRFNGTDVSAKINDSVTESGELKIE